MAPAAPAAPPSPGWCSQAAARPNNSRFSPAAERDAPPCRQIYPRAAASTFIALFFRTVMSGLVRHRPTVYVEKTGRAAASILRPGDEQEVDVSAVMEKLLRRLAPPSPHPLPPPPFITPPH